jgi:TolB protein
MALIAGTISLNLAGHGQARAQETTPMPTQPTPQAMLAVIEADGNLSIYDANGLNPIRLTTDAVPGEKLYLWPTWSTDGRLAFFGASNQRPDAYSLRVFIVPQVAPGAVPQVAYTSRDDIFTYPYWSTGNCGTPGCRDLLLLYTPASGTGLALRRIRDDGGAFSTAVLGEAAPFYYSFSPDGSRMIWARFGNELGIFDTRTDTLTPLADAHGRFNSPMWSPVDNRILIGVEGSTPDLVNLVIVDDKTRVTLLKDQETPISFAWSPDGTKVASVAGFGNLVITDCATGQQVTRSTQSNIAAQFWAPTSDRVAYLVVNRTEPGPQARLHVNGRMPVEQASGGLSLYVLDIKTGNSQAIATFNPSRDFVYLLNFFDQFAHSHQLWSPDGKYITYSALDSKGNANVFIADTTAPTTPFKVTSGSIGIWSYPAAK